MKKLFLLLSLCSVFSMHNAFAGMGIHGAYPLSSSEPEHLRGGQLFLSYDPGNLQWQQLSVLFDAGYSHFTTNEAPIHTAINIYSVAPILRYSFSQSSYLTPYIDLSVGIAYLDRTRLGHRNLGIHFSFQDRVALGVLIGHEKQFSLSLQALHYSNAHLSSNNSGITAPLVLDVGYTFN